MQIDANGIATIIVAVSTAIVTVGTFVFNEMRKLHTAVAETKDLVNGLSEKRQAEAKSVGKAEGKEEGRAEGDAKAAAAMELAKVIVDKVAPSPPQ